MLFGVFEYLSDICQSDPTDSDKVLDICKYDICKSDPADSDKLVVHHVIGLASLQIFTALQGARQRTPGFLAGFDHPC